MDSSIKEYQLQLDAVERALLVANDDAERASLLSLRSDLLELLELTRQTEGLVDDATENKTQNLDSEMHQFMQEIQKLDSEAKPADEKNATNVAAELLELRQQLEKMVGEKCSAPHQHTWGATTFHNAIICGIGETADLDSDGTLNEICLRVLFTNPTHREMLPCSYFLEGECKFDAAQCHFSHGELVPFGDLREYTEPDFQRLARNCVVLAKMDDRLWHRGRVLCSNFVEKQCRVRLDGNQHKVKELDLSFENLFPIYHDEDLSSGSSTNGDTDSDSEELDELEAARRTRLVEQSLFTFPANQPLGEWEKHTRGIGSKLMAKMGYIHGTGLGDNGRGIITPISAQILPQGCSLDHCMGLREAANGDKDLFNVEKQLKRKQKKQEALNVKAYERESQRADVFSFLNDTVFTNNQKSENTANGKNSVTKTSSSKTSIKDQTTKSLNVESVRIADNIRKKEREIVKIKESLQRNAATTDVHKRLQVQLSTKTEELNFLNGVQCSLTKEQMTRKTKDKLSVF